MIIWKLTHEGKVHFESTKDRAQEVARHIKKHDRLIVNVEKVKLESSPGRWVNNETVVNFINGLLKELEVQL